MSHNEQGGGRGGLRRRLLGFRGRVVCALVAVAGLASSASAQFVPEELDAVVFPITLASIVEAILVAGGAMLAAFLLIMIAFKLVKKFARRAASAV